MTEYAADGTAGNSLTMDYSKQNTTVFTYGKTSGTVSETYQFNNWGHTTGILGEDGSMAEIQYNTFDGTKANAAQLATNNKVTKVGAGTKYVHNMLLNHSVILSILVYTFFSRMFDLCCLLQRSIILLSLNHWRQSTIRRTYPAVVPVGKEVSPDECF